MAALIRIDAIWLATEPVDMRAGAETLLARVVKVFGAARPVYYARIVHRGTHIEGLAPEYSIPGNCPEYLVRQRSRVSRPTSHEKFDSPLQSRLTRQLLYKI